MYDGTRIINDPMLLETITEDLPEGVVAYVLADDDPGDSPREWGVRVATIINENSRHIDIDEDVAGLTEARDHFTDEALMRRYLAMFRPDVLYYDEYVSWGRDGYGWGYITRDAWVEHMGHRPLLEGDEQLREVFDSEVEEYRQWAEGEVYGVIVTHEESGQEASLWSIYDSDGSYIREHVIPELIEELDL